MPPKIDQETIDAIRTYSRTHSKRDVATLFEISYRTVLRYTTDIPKTRGQRPPHALVPIRDRIAIDQE